MAKKLGVMGIDPGKTGGISIVYDVGDAEVHKMPATIPDVVDLIISLKHKASICVLEKVHAMPKQGVTSVFTFGTGFGVLQAALAAAKIPVMLVSPAKWQMALGCKSGGKKNVTKAAAQRLFPDIKMTHALADALLIGEYGRRTYYDSK